MESAEGTTNWNKIMTVDFAYMSGGDRVEGTAELFEYTGPRPKSGKPPAIGATYTARHAPNAYVCSGDLSAAILKAAGRSGRYRHSSAKMEYTDWGGPIGKPATAKTLVWSDPNKR